MQVETSYELVRKVRGPLEAVINAEAGPAIELADVVKALNDNAFVVETIAHLRGMPELLDTSDNARRIAKALEGAK